MTIIWTTDADMTPHQAAAEKAHAEAIKWAVRDALRAAGADGLTTADLYARFGPCAVRRLNELRKAHGYDYTRRYVGRRTYRYVLIEPTDVARPAQTVSESAISRAARILAQARRDRRVAARASTPSLF